MGLQIRFEIYTAKFSKQYKTQAEREFRMELFGKIDKYIENWNSQEGRTHTLAHNAFSDWTDEERDQLTGYKEGPTKKGNESKTEPAEIPDSFDWRDHGAVNPV